LESLFQDVRYALRMMAHRPGFTLAAVLSLALGIGANSTIFMLAKAAFLQAVPVKDPGSLVMVYSTQNNPRGPEFQYLNLSIPNALDYRQKNDVFSGLSVIVNTRLTLDISGKDTQVASALVNWDFFNIVGVQPAAGRIFTPDEDSRSGGGPVAILSYALWNKQFGADGGILGRTIRLNHLNFTVIGIAPKEFHDAGALLNPDVWVPISMGDQLLAGIAKEWFHDRGSRLGSAVARLKPGVTLERARDSLGALAANLEREFPTDNSGRSVQVVPISNTVLPPEQRGVALQAATIMIAIVALVLLIACANVANLLLSRASLRQREIAVRLSLGAKRWRLVRQLLTESLLLGLTAGALAVVVAFWGRGLIRGLLPNGFPANLDFSLDARVLLFTLGISLAATLLFGLAPALQSSSGANLNSLRDRTAISTSGSTRWYGLRGALVMVQVALSLVALVGAGMFIHSLANAQQIDPGFETKHEITMFINLAAADYTQPKAEQFFKDVVQRLRGLPMVADASIADTAPLSGGLQRTTFPEGVDASNARNGALTPVIAVQPGYFSATGTSLLRGRDFNDHDNENAPMVAIVNRAFADHVWPDQDAIGRHLRFLGQDWDVSIVGVASTVKYTTLGEPPQPIVYFPLKQHYSAGINLYVRTKGDANPAIGSIRSAVQSLDPTLQLRRVITVSDLLNQSLTAPRVGAELLGTFGGLALVLAAIGTYGVMSYSVSQRTQEIGIRMALGAQKRDVLRLVMLSGMATVCVGILVGLVFSTLLTRAMHSLLYGIGIFDLFSFLGTSLLLIVVAAIACGIPALRASTIDPMVALRYE
jgi:predicted permease